MAYVWGAEDGASGPDAARAASAPQVRPAPVATSGPRIAGMAFAAFGLALSTSCTRINPAFKDSRGASASSATSATTEGTGTDEVGSSADEVGTLDSGVSSVSTDPTDTYDTTDTADTTDTTDTGVPECFLPWTNRLFFKYLADVTTSGCDGELGGYFFVSGVSTANGLVATQCDEFCETCDGGPAEIEIFPVNLTEAATELSGQCVFARWEQLINADDVSCTYEKFMLSAVIQDIPIPLFIGASGDGQPPSFSSAVLGEWTPLLVEDDVCDCGTVGNSCCDVLAPPTQYAFSVDDGPVVPVGDFGPVTILSTEWDFFGIQAQELDSCGANLEVSWLLVDSATEP